MPTTIKEVDGFRVSTPGGVKAKNTTLGKAKAQERLLNAVEHNPNFKPRKKANRSFGIRTGKPTRTRSRARQRSNFGIRRK